MSTVDDIERAVLDDLVRGRLAPGTRLRQDELAARLGVSKIPVREALQRLSASGVLVFETNRGVRVPLLTVDDAVEISTLRRSIEVDLLRRAVARITIVDLAAAEHALAADSSASTPIPTTETNWRFHLALYRASGWHKALAIAEQLHATMAPYVLLYLRSLGGDVPSDAEHLALLDACRRGHVDDAIELLEIHLDGAARTVIDFLQQGATNR